MSTIPRHTGDNEHNTRGACLRQPLSVIMYYAKKENMHVIIFVQKQKRVFIKIQYDGI